MNLTVLAMGLMFGLGAIGSGIGIGIMYSRYLEGIARQPEAQGRLSTQMFVGLGLVDALPIIVVAMAFILFTRI